MTSVEFDFDGFRMTADRALLRPRGWTVAQSRWARNLLPTVPEGPVLELCAGAGHIGLAAVHDSDRRLVAIDRDPAAAACIRANARQLRMTERVDVRCGPLDEVLAAGETFALAIADPPWVRHAAVFEHPEDPPSAIDGGEDGMEVARRCITAIEDHVMPGGVTVLQLGCIDQVESLELSSRMRTNGTRAYSRGVLVRIDMHPCNDADTNWRRSVHE